MRDESHVYAASCGEETRHVLAAEAVADPANAADVEVVVDVVDCKAEYTLDLGWGVAGQPLGEVEGGTFAVVDGDGIAGE